MQLKVSSWLRVWQAACMADCCPAMQEQDHGCEAVQHALAGAGGGTGIDSTKELQLSNMELSPITPKKSRSACCAALLLGLPVGLWMACWTWGPAHAPLFGLRELCMSWQRFAHEDRPCQYQAELMSLLDALTWGTAT